MLNRIKHNIKNVLVTTLFRLGFDSMRGYLHQVEKIPGWVTMMELAQKGESSLKLPDNAMIVEIGVFLGRSSIVIAGARKLRGNGIVHSIDPFDASGDAFSVPVYKSIEDKYRRICSGYPRCKQTGYYAFARTSSASLSFEPTQQAARYFASQ